MRFIKYSFFLILLSLQSCEFLNDEDDSNRKIYSCSLNVKINNWSKSTRECSYVINYSKTESLVSSGYFQLTMKNNSSTYTVLTSKLTLEEGNHTISVEIRNCKFQDEITAVCFLTK